MDGSANETAPRAARGRRLRRALVLCFVIVSIVRYLVVLWDLERSHRRAAWRELHDQRITDLAMHSTVDDPDAVRLWLEAGRDPNGHDCAAFTDRPPSAFVVAFVGPLRLCGPYDADEMPFMSAVVGPYSEGRLKSAKLMIDAGVDVNEASPEGIIPLRAAVAARNRPLVQMLLAAGADPDRRSAKGPRPDSDEYGSARQLVDKYESDPEMRSFAELLEQAVPRTRKRGNGR